MCYTHDCNVSCNRPAVPSAVDRGVKKTLLVFQFLTRGDEKNHSIIKDCDGSNKFRYIQRS